MDKVMGDAGLVGGTKLFTDAVELSINPKLQLFPLKVVE